MKADNIDKYTSRFKELNSIYTESQLCSQILDPIIEKLTNCDNIVSEKDLEKFLLNLLYAHEFLKAPMKNESEDIFRNGFITACDYIINCTENSLEQMLTSVSEKDVKGLFEERKRPYTKNIEIRHGSLPLPVQDFEENWINTSITHSNDQVLAQMYSDLANYIACGLNSISDSDISADLIEFNKE